MSTISAQYGMLILLLTEGAPRDAARLRVMCRSNLDLAPVPVPIPPFASSAVVGAGLAGSMMALMLGRKGYTVELFEKRPDFRAEERAEREAEAYVTSIRVQLPVLAHRLNFGLSSPAPSHMFLEPC